MDDKTRNRVLLVLFLGVLMGALDIAIVSPALTSIQKYFEINDRLLSWTLSIYLLFNLIGTPLMAKLSDKMGRRSIYILDVAIFAIGSLVVALAPKNIFSILLLGRALQGFGAGGVFPVASAVIGDSFPPEKRGSALGLIGAVFGLAFLIGPILGGIILSFTGWQWLFIINLPISAVVIFMGMRLLPTTRPETQRAFDWAGMLVLGVLLSSLAYGLNQIDTEDFIGSLLSLDVWPFLVVAILLMVVFIVVERKASDPVLRLTLFNSRQAVLSSILAAGSGFEMIGLVFIPSLALSAIPSITDKHTASYLLIPVVLVMAIFSPIAGRLLDKIGSKLIVMSGAALVAIGMLMLSYRGVTSVLGLFILAGAVIGLGLAALLGAPIRYIMLTEAPASERTAAQGAINLFISIGQLTASALVGAIAASQGGGVKGYSSAYLFIGIITSGMFLLTLGLKNHKEEFATPERVRIHATAD